MRIQPKELKERILRALGSPILDPIITDNQLTQAIDDAIKLYTEFHHAGSYKDYLIIRVNDDNVGKTGIFQLNHNVLAVTDILRSGNNLKMMGVTDIDGATDMWFSSLFTNALGGFGAGSTCSVGLSSLSGMGPLFSILDMNMGMWKERLDPQKEFIFNSANKTLMIPDSNIKEGGIIVCEAYLQSTMGMYEGGYGPIAGASTATSEANLSLNGGSYDDLQARYHHGYINPQIGDTQPSQGGLNDRWVIEYATAKAKYQWGMNLTYMSGVSQSSGGVKIDGQILKEEAQVEMNRLKYEVRSMGDHPIMMLG